MSSRTIDLSDLVTTRLLEQLSEALEPFGVLVTGEPHGSNPSLIRSLTFSTVQHQRRTPLIAVHGVFGAPLSEEERAMVEESERCLAARERGKSAEEIEDIIAGMRSVDFRGGAT